jgi:hypothetical protein
VILTSMRLLAVAQAACVPPTVSVKVSQLVPSTHVLSPFADGGTPGAVPSQARGEPVGLAIVPDAGVADRDLVVESASTTRTMPAIRKSVPMVARAVAEEEFFFITGPFDWRLDSAPAPLLLNRKVEENWLHARCTLGLIFDKVRDSGFSRFCSINRVDSGRIRIFLLSAPVIVIYRRSQAPKILPSVRSTSS